MKSAPWLQLARVASAQRLLERVVRDGDELAHVLRQYPVLRYEPLDFHYACLQSLGAFNAQLLEQLCTEQGASGVVWAAFVAALEPRSAYGEVLLRAKPTSQVGRWLVELALAETQGTQIPDATYAVQELVRALRHQLSGLSRPEVRLRRAPAAEDLQRIQQSVLAAYRLGGLNAALSARAAERVRLPE